MAPVDPFEYLPAGPPDRVLVALDGTWCPCVINHNPEPVEDEIHHLVPLGSPFHGADIPENRRRLCGTMHGSVHAYHRMVLAARKRGTPIDRVKAAHFSPFARRLADIAFHALDAQEPSDRPLEVDRAWINAQWDT